MPEYEKQTNITPGRVSYCIKDNHKAREVSEYANEQKRAKGMHLKQHKATFPDEAACSMEFSPERRINPFKNNGISS